MSTSAQVELWPAEKVAAQVTVGPAPNGVHFAAWGETRVPEADLTHLVGVVPSALSAALAQRAYYFVPLAIADTGEVLIAPSYTVELGDRAICHRNATFGSTEAVFLSTRLVEDRFGLAFEFFINVAHNLLNQQGFPRAFQRLRGRRLRPRSAGKPARTPGNPVAALRTFNSCRSGQEGHRRTGSHSLFRLRIF